MLFLRRINGDTALHDAILKQAETIDSNTEPV